MPTKNEPFGLQRASSRVGAIINPAININPAHGNTQQSGRGHVARHYGSGRVYTGRERHYATRQKIIEPIIISDIVYTGCGAEDSFHNLQEFNAGFAQRLLLKDDAVPTLKAEAAVYGPQTVSTFYCLYVF